MQALLDDLRKQLDTSGAELARLVAERDLLTLKARKIRTGRKKLLDAIINLEEEMASCDKSWVLNTGERPAYLNTRKGILS